jgi:hypothetical protein
MSRIFLESAIEDDGAPHNLAGLKLPVATNDRRGKEYSRKRQRVKKYRLEHSRNDFF